MNTVSPLFKDRGISVYLDEEVPCLINEWNGFVPSYRFREYILKLLDIYKEHSQNYECLALLADTRKLHVLSADDTSWVSREINPKYIESGCRYEAFLAPRDICGESAVKNYIDESTSAGPFTTKMFSSLSEAKSWLMEVQENVAAGRFQ